MPHHANHVRWHHHPIARRHVKAVDHDELLPHLQVRSTSECKDGDTSNQCEKPAGSAPTLPIVLGALVPIFCAVLVLIWLHRRHMQKLKQEDATDKTKSMDFGLGISRSIGSDDPNEKNESRSRKQLSMDMDAVASPYLLPSAENGSRQSLHSIARTVHSVEDRYGRPTTAGNDSANQTKSEHRRDSSIYAQDSPDGSKESMDTGLLGNAQRMPTSSPPPPHRAKLEPQHIPQPIIPQIKIPPPTARASPIGLPSSPRDGNFAVGKSADIRGKSQLSGSNLPAALQVGGDQSPSVEGLYFEDLPSKPMSSERPVSNDHSDYGDDIQFRFSAASEVPTVVELGEQDKSRKSLAPGAYDTSRLSMGFRPLPPDGNPDDTAEERAMRIRSFYKEYFSVEESGPVPPMPQHIPAEFAREPTTYSDDTAIFDPETGRFILPGAGSKPFAEPPARRAMTPPPRMPPRFEGPPRVGSATGGRFVPPGPRSFSSASGHAGPRSVTQQQNKRPLEPPKPLNILPNPSKVSEDAFASPIMFAPPIRVTREGDADSHRGGLRPYSPSVSPHNPLVSSFDDLASLPTPHMLRNSGAFTSLDFAPPKKFKNEDSNDAGSIRSNRSGASALQVHNIRNGAYRVSRIPQDVVPTKGALADELKPTWDAHGR
ncbi:hypothetical protein EDC01DRAFT_623031 [Geopyxis carbonaria]|nr:hypothetical protein EDC01DRAFT_623031 [Geopyxis carbonaria]